MNHHALAVLVLLLPTAVHAEDWPEFRGPTGQGHVRGGRLPLNWSATQNVVWKQPIPGRGWSSPILVAGRIYLTTSMPVGDRGDQSLRALCLDGVTGKILWDVEVFREDRTAARIHGKNSHASPTPLCDGERLYVHFGHQGTACLDLTGKLLWQNRTLRYQPVHGNGGSPVLVADKLVFSCDGGDQRFVVALDRSTGRVIWKTPRAGNTSRPFSFSTPLLIEVKGRQQLVSPGSDMVAAYDPQTGQEIWQVRYDGYSIIPRPVFGHGLVFICTGYTQPSLLAIRPDGMGDVTTTHAAWTARRGVPHTASLLLHGDELYMVSDNGIASCLDAKTGKTHWERRLGGNYSASPILADGHVYFLSEEGVGTVIKAGRKLQQVARNALEERTLASYAAVDGALYIRTEQYLYRFEGR